MLHDPINNNENVLILVDICRADTVLEKGEREWEAIRIAHNQFLMLATWRV